MPARLTAPRKEARDGKNRRLDATDGSHDRLDHNAPRTGTDEFRVVQLTPPGSNCPIQIGVGLTDAAPGSMRGIYAVVDDLQHVRGELLERGVDIGEIRHKASLADWRGDWAPGLDPDRTDYASFADFHDPDGNQWVLQERGLRR